MSIKVLAQRMFTTPQRVSAIEVGHPRDMIVRTVDLYARALGAELRMALVFPDGRVVHVEVDEKS